MGRQAKELNRYTAEEALLWHLDYQDYRVAARAVSKKYGIKHETMLRWFRKLGLKLRPDGFRPNNCRGRNGEDVLSLKYLWLYKFTYKRRAERKNQEFNLSPERFIAIVTGNCAYCGKSHLDETRLVNKTRIPMLTVDRVDSKRGYVEGNCVAACKNCNMMKLDLRVPDFIAHIKRIVSFQSQKPE